MHKNEDGLQNPSTKNSVGQYYTNLNHFEKASFPKMDDPAHIMKKITPKSVRAITRSKSTVNQRDRSLIKLQRVEAQAKLISAIQKEGQLAGWAEAEEIIPIPASSNNFQPSRKLRAVISSQRMTPQTPESNTTRNSTRPQSSANLSGKKLDRSESREKKISIANLLQGNVTQRQRSTVSPSLAFSAEKPSTRDYETALQTLKVSSYTHRDRDMTPMSTHENLIRPRPLSSSGNKKILTLAKPPETQKRAVTSQKVCGFDLIAEDPTPKQQQSIGKFLTNMKTLTTIQNIESRADSPLLTCIKGLGSLYTFEEEILDAKIAAQKKSLKAERANSFIKFFEAKAKSYVENKNQPSPNLSPQKLGHPENPSPLDLEDDRMSFMPSIRQNASPFLSGDVTPLRRKPSNGMSLTPSVTFLKNSGVGGGETESTPRLLLTSRLTSSRAKSAARDHDRRLSSIPSERSGDRTLSLPKKRSFQIRLFNGGEPEVTDSPIETKESLQPRGSALLIKDLVEYTRTKSKEIEEYIREEAKEIAAKDPNNKYAETFALAEIVETRGGMSHQPLTTSKSKIILFNSQFNRNKENFRFE